MFTAVSKLKEIQELLIVAYFISYDSHNMKLIIDQQGWVWDGSHSFVN